MNEQEFKDWVEEGNRKCWAIRVADRFGDYGLTGIISVEVDNEKLRVVDFLLSCRVMGRHVEEAMISTAVKYGQKLNLKEMVAVFVATPRNKPCLEFWQRSGFKELAQSHEFIWSISENYALPEFIQISAVD